MPDLPFVLGCEIPALGSSPSARVVLRPDAAGIRRVHTIPTARETCSLYVELGAQARHVPGELSVGAE